MKHFALTLGLIAAIAAIPPQARTEQPKVFVPLARCVIVVVMVAAGGVIIYCVKKYCDQTFSNHNWQITNDDSFTGAVGPLVSGATGDGTTTVQSCEGMGSVWVNGQSINLVQSNGLLIGVLSDESGKPVATNSVPVTGDGQMVVLDFRKALPPVTNAPSQTMLFRLIN